MDRVSNLVILPRYQDDQDVKRTGRACTPIVFAPKTHGFLPFASDKEPLYTLYPCANVSAYLSNFRTNPLAGVSL